MKNLLLISLLLLTHLLQAQNKDIENLLFAGEYQKAIPLIEQQIQQNKNNSKLYFLLAKAYENSNQNKQAIDNYRKAIKLQPNYPVALFNLSSCLFRAGNYNATIDNLKKHNSITKNNLNGNLLLAKTYSTLGEYKKAIGIYNKLIKQDSTNANLYKLLGKTKSRQQDYLGATNAYLKSYKYNKTNLAVIIALAQNFYDMATYKQAIAYINKGLDIYPKNRILLKKKAKCLMGLKWFPIAMLILREMEKKHQLNANGYKMLGICYMQMQGSYIQNALEAFNKCGETYEKDPMLNYYKGYCLLKSNKYKDAIKHLNNAITYITSPSKAAMHLHLAKAYGMTREFEKSIEQYKKSYELNPKKNILYEIATTYEEFEKDKKNALKYYTMFVQSTTNKDSKHYEYAKGRILYIKEKIYWEK